ncbi:heme exporter protein CcmD [Epibacterium ulvae]|uniref:heme exporter protein CcmD n=1 Tax=Epibacterium ulvae TaxID=1156985 RepID=UPI001BFC32D5|nr:heme exporter protein CcmD [Epibacterium ulvae]MBT8155405.1 heme exporter protein CcmD [Epibacterium ulvae]
MIDLGRYAGAVLSAYGVSLAMLVALVLLSLRRGRKVRADMEMIEERGRANG